MLALYRKYRPKSLSEVIGQESITKNLESSIASGKISHAYLFTGPRGTGKTSVARIFAHEINNFPYTLEDSYLDIIEIDAASNTGVDNIRELREKAIIAPSKGKYKVYIIDEVHMLSKSAFNALLKTLEEPPAHVIFIMATTDAHKVPVTISSRSQVFTFSLASIDTMQKYLKKIANLEKIKINDDALEIIAHRGGGSFRDSLSLLDQISTLGDSKTVISEQAVVDALGLPQDFLIEKILTAYSNSSIDAISTLLKQILNSGVKPETLAEEIIKKILDSPKPKLFPLLEKLPLVSAPFPEAKLLLAFYDDSMKKNEAHVEMAQKTTPETIELSKNKPRQIFNDESHDKAKNSASVIAFDQNTFLESIRLSNVVIYKQLEKCTFSISGNILNVFPDKQIIKSILNRPNNFEVLSSNIPKGLEVVVRDPDDKKSFAKDSALSKISDIMGEGIKEVENGGGIPF